MYDFGEPFDFSIGVHSLENLIYNIKEHGIWDEIKKNTTTSKIKLPDPGSYPIRNNYAKGAYYTYIRDKIVSDLSYIDKSKPEIKNLFTNICENNDYVFSNGLWCATIVTEYLVIDVLMI